MSNQPEVNSGEPLSTIFPIKIILPAVAVLSTLFFIILMIYFRVKNQRDSFSSSRLALDTATLNALPVTVFSSANSDCAICLADLAAGELGRLLPGCNHGFHRDCIDEWFLVDSTCPICRSSVDPPQKLPATLVIEAAIMDIKEGALEPTASSISTAHGGSGGKLRFGAVSGGDEAAGYGEFEMVENDNGRACSSIGWDVEKGAALAPGVARDL